MGLEGVTDMLSGTSNDSCTPKVVELSGTVALKPSPRLANAVPQDSDWRPG